MFNNDVVTLAEVKKNIDEWIQNKKPSLDNLMCLVSNLKLTTDDDSPIHCSLQAWVFRKAIVKNMLTGIWDMPPAAYARYISDGFKKVLSQEEVLVENESYIKYVDNICGEYGVTNPYVDPKNILLTWLQSENGLNNLLEVSRTWLTILTWINTNASTITGYYGSVSFNTANNGQSTLILGKNKQEITKIIYDN